MQWKNITSFWNVTGLSISYTLSVVDGRGKKPCLPTQEMRMEVLLPPCCPTQSWELPLNHKPKPAATSFFNDLSDDSSVKSSICYVEWKKLGAPGLVKGLAVNPEHHSLSQVLRTAARPFVQGVPVRNSAAQEVRTAKSSLCPEVGGCVRHSGK